MALRCCGGVAMPAAVSLPRGRQARRLLRREALVLGARQVRPEPYQPATRSGQDLGRHRWRDLGRHAGPSEARLDLEVEAQLRLLRPAGFAAAATPPPRREECPDEPGIRCHELEAGPRCGGDLGGRDAEQDHDRRRDPRTSQRDRLIEHGDAQPVGTAVHEGAGRADQPVAIAVTLDHGRDLDAGRDHRPDDAEVVRQGVLVDLQPRETWQRRQAGGRQRLLDEGPRRPRPVRTDGHASRTRSAKPSLRPPSSRSRTVARSRRTRAMAGGRSEATSPASPSRSAMAAPAAPWR